MVGGGDRNKEEKHCELKTLYRHLREQATGLAQALWIPGRA